MSSDTINKTNLWYTTKQVKKKSSKRGVEPGTSAFRVERSIAEPKNGFEKQSPGEHIFNSGAYLNKKKETKKKK